MARNPLPHSHWIQPGRLLAGEHPAGEDDKATRKRLAKLLDAGIDCFIDLTEPEERESYQPLLASARGGDQAAYVRRPIRDHGVPHSEAGMRLILDTLDHALAEGKSVYLHCLAGIGRTNLVAGCWLASRSGDGEAALELLNRAWRGNARSRRWPRIPETDEQADFVRSWGAPRAQPGPAAAVAPPAGGLRDRVRGMLLGLAAGDALGHAAHGLPAGAWSDKTAMALCLADSLVSRGGADAADQVARYRDWQQSGRWSSTGVCIGISAATGRALAAAQWSGNPYAGSHDPSHADAEPLARVGPAVAWFSARPDQAIEAAVNCARVTHQAPLTLEAMRLFAALLAGALAGRDKPALLAADFTPAPAVWRPETLRSPVREIAAGAGRGRAARRLLRGKLAVVAALEATLSAFEAGGDLEGCLAFAASRPDGGPVAAAMAGQLAGACYGAAALPERLRGSLARIAEIEALADALVDRAPREPAP